MAQAAGNSGGVPVRFYLQIEESTNPAAFSQPKSAVPTVTQVIEGQTHAMTCQPQQTFGEIKHKIWQKKGLPLADEACYTFKLTTGEFVFQDIDTVSRFLELN